MGALNEKRRGTFVGYWYLMNAEEFQMRYDSWEDDTIPKFHYGTHYSSAAIVLYYLIRLAPFTQHAIQLQVFYNSLPI